MAKVSVIMPAYNAEQFIEIAISSVLSQSFKDWELIVINDGSSDSTSRILEQYTNRKIKIIYQENSGEACARNVGLENAHGEYIAFLDADDFYYPTALEDFVFFLDSHQEYDIAYSDGTICDEIGNTLMSLSDIRPTLISGNLLESLVLSSHMVTCCTMTRYSKIQKGAIRFDKNLAIGPDWDFWIQLAVNSQFGYLPAVTGCYRIHQANITRTVDQRKRRGDRAFGRLKVLNSDWFDDLSLSTRELFFLDLLTNVLSGDLENQRKIIKNDRFVELSETKQADLWRLVGIDILKTSRNSNLARSYLLQSLNLNAGDWKTRSLLWSLRFGSSPALMFIKIWHFLLYFKKGMLFPRNSPSERLQKMLGVR